MLRRGKEPKAVLMKYLLSLLAWTIGSLVSLVLVPVLLIVPFFLTPKGISNLGKFVTRQIVRGFLVRVRCEGREEVDSSRCYVFMANHASFLDFFLLGGYLPGNTRGLEAAEHFKMPVWGTVLRRLGIIPIDRSNPRASSPSGYHTSRAG